MGAVYWSVVLENGSWRFSEVKAHSRQASRRWFWQCIHAVQQVNVIAGTPLALVLTSPACRGPRSKATPVCTISEDLASSASSGARGTAIYSYCFSDIWRATRRVSTGLDWRPDD